MSDDNKPQNALAAVVTLRDYFAAYAPDPGFMLGDAAEFLGEDVPKTTEGCAFLAIRARAKAAYLYADAMLKARGEG